VLRVRSWESSHVQPMHDTTSVSAAHNPKWGNAMAKPLVTFMPFFCSRSKLRQVVRSHTECNSAGLLSLTLCQKKDTSRQLADHIHECWRALVPDLLPRLARVL